MKICIYGLGAVGGLIGGKLALSGQQVSAVARGATLEAVKKNGLMLSCQEHNEIAKINVASDPADLGPQDVVFITVKSTAIGAVAKNIRPLLHEKTVVVSAMNGVPWWFYYGLHPEKTAPDFLNTVDPDGIVTEAIDAKRVVGCVSNLSSSTPQPGVVKHLPNPRFTFGEPTGGAQTDRCASIISACRSAGLDAQESESIQQTIWFKLWGNMTLNPISALTVSTSDRIVADPLVRDFMARCMNEANEIGAKIGIKIDSTPEARFDATRRLGVFRTSMLQDVDANRPIELDALVGAVREIAMHAGVATPNIDALFGLTRLNAQTLGLYPSST